ncbi:MAG: FAD-dependent tricarballylate dehydrogenase TcuA [Propionibacteriaceae bacterium]
MTEAEQVDVLVVGGGNAGFSAGLAAAERGRRVLVLEKGSEPESGGNSFYTAGAMRIAHHGLDDVRPLLEEDPRTEVTELPPYPPDAFHADMSRITEGACDPALTEVLIRDSKSALEWLHSLGLRFRLMYERQAYQDSAGGYRFWGGLAIGTVDGGKGLMATHAKLAADHGVEVRYSQRVTGLLTDSGRVTGVRVDDGAGEHAIRAGSVILAAGGFEANAAMRMEHLGPEWEHAKVRGTPLNTGDLFRAALDIGAQAAGDWTTCHSVAWETNSPASGGDRELTNQHTRGSYPLGIVVNTDGVRFVDEGADFRNYTYAKYGAAILRQPGGVAFQVFDATTRRLLRAEEYDHAGTTEYTASSWAELEEQLQLPIGSLAATVADFNSSIATGHDFDPSTLDGRSAATSPPKTNWAAALTEPPFSAFPVTCGITFTFGGLQADTDARVLDQDGDPIPGLYVCGEMLGGLFSGNYPGGSGLTSGTVFGRRAGSLA